MPLDLYNTVANGFATGLGVGLSNWLLIKRLESLEVKLKEKKI